MKVSFYEVYRIFINAVIETWFRFFVVESDFLEMCHKLIVLQNEKTIVVIELLSEEIHVRPIGFVKRSSSNEDERDRRLVSKIVLKKDFTKGLDGIEEWSHVYVIFWMHKISDKEKMLVHPGEGRNVGIFATRAPVRPNPIGLTLVELVKRDENVIWVKGLDAYDDTLVLDIKPYPDWEHGRLIVVTDFRVPKWLTKIIRNDFRKKERL